MTEETFTDAELTACLPPLRNFARSLTKCPAAGDDLAQDVMLRCLRKRHLFRGGNLEAWTFTMCRRLFYNDQRPARAKALHVDVTEVDHASFSHQASQPDHSHLRRVVACFRQLAYSDQMIICLVAIEGMAYRDVADALDIEVGTVRSRLSRARAKLARLVDGIQADAEDDRPSSASRHLAGFVQRSLAS